MQHKYIQFKETTEIGSAQWIADIRYKVASEDTDYYILKDKGKPYKFKKSLEDKEYRIGFINYNN